jgi:leader peptidase (prepilin peptidase)/N-methyltransferase
MLELYPTFGWIGAGVLGLLVGSFLNVVIYRLPKMMERDWRLQCIEFLGPDNVSEAAKKIDGPAKFNLVTPNSTCPHCGHKIKPWENIPVISYLFLRGRCSSCSAHISLRYPVIELVTGVLSVISVYTFGANPVGLACLFFVWCLIALITRQHYAPPVMGWADTELFWLLYHAGIRCMGSYWRLYVAIQCLLVI